MVRACAVLTAHCHHRLHPHLGAHSTRIITLLLLLSRILDRSSRDVHYTNTVHRAEASHIPMMVLIIDVLSTLFLLVSQTTGLLLLLLLRL